MSTYLWLCPLSHRLLGRPARRASSTRPAVSSRRRVRPCLEVLEDRITPNNTFTVTNVTEDPSKGLTLRQAISDANADKTTGIDTIQLTAPGGEYQLTSSAGALQITSTSHTLVIEGTVASDGTPATVISQSEDVLDRVFQIVNPGTNVLFKNLTIQGGQAFNDGSGPFDTTAEGGGILDEGGNVTLSNVSLLKNVASGNLGVGAEGGGIYVGSGGSLLIENHCEINNNQAVGGGGTGDASKPDSRGGDAQGGGIYTLSATTIVNSNVSGNTVNAGTSDSSAGEGGNASGGGVFAIAPTVIQNSTFIDNTLNAGEPLGGSGGVAEGGGLFLHGPTSITGCTLDDNTVNGAFAPHSIGGEAAGGGAYLDFVANTPMEIIDSTLDDNVLNGGGGNVDTASNTGGADVGGVAEGGGIYDLSNPMVISGCILSDAVLTGGQGTLSSTGATLGGGTIGGAASGGGIFVNNALGAGKTTIDSSIITDNILQGGPGTFHTGSGVFSVGGTASGGGLYVNTASINASTLSGNTATGGSGTGGGSAATGGLALGGGAFFDGGGNTLINSTIADNRAIGGQGVPVNPVAAGGGLYFAPTAAGALTNDTVADNGADRSPSGGGDTDGGGIANFGGPMTLVNTLVAGNNASNGPDYFGIVSSSDRNLIGNAAGSSGFSTSDLVGNTANPLNPQLGSLTTINGGTLAGAPGSQQVVPTLPLLPNSPAINAGDNSEESLTGPFDERGPGFARVVGGKIDIGAFEVQPPPRPLAPPPSPAPPPMLHTPPLLAFFDSLLAAVETVNGNDAETVTDSLFGIPLIVSLYDGAGNLVSVTLFGINVTFLFESL
jgi:hypothetical protein